MNKSTFLWIPLAVWVVMTSGCLPNSWHECWRCPSTYELVLSIRLLRLEPFTVIFAVLTEAGEEDWIDKKQA